MQAHGWKSDKEIEEDSEEKLKMIQIESRRLKLLEEAEGKKKTAGMVDRMTTAQVRSEEEQRLKEFVAEQEVERRTEAVQKHKSKELVKRMTSAEGIEQKLDSIIAVIADNSGRHYTLVCLYSLIQYIKIIKSILQQLSWPCARTSGLYMRQCASILTI